MEEPEVLWARRAFAKAQELLAGSPTPTAALELQTGWHDTTTHRETGAFAVVRTDAGLDDLIGEIVRVTLGARSCFVYVMEAVDVPTDFSLARRAFSALAALTTESVTCDVEVVQ